MNFQSYVDQQCRDDEPEVGLVGPWVFVREVPADEVWRWEAEAGPFSLRLTATVDAEDGELSFVARAEVPAWAEEDSDFFLRSAPEAARRAVELARDWIIREPAEIAELARDDGRAMFAALDRLEGLTR